MSRPLTLLALALLAFPTAARAATIVHSGYLLSSGDVPVDGSVTMTFTISDSAVAAGETVAWTTTCAVSVASGYYAVELGAGACGPAIGAGVTDTAAPRWLAVQVGAVSLSPRHPITPVTRASYAELAGGLSSSVLSTLVTRADLGSISLPATGTPDSTTFLRGDGAWAQPPTNNGPQGAQGVQGPPGAAGATWRTGAGAPASGLGVDGDLYLDTVAPNTFYKRVSGRYVAQGNLSSGAAIASLTTTVAALQTKVDNIFPIGTVVASMMAPAAFLTDMGPNWVLADGRTANVEYVAKYPSATNIPDLRGQFLRGLNVDGRQDPDAASRLGGDVAGSYQGDELKSHTHSYIQYNQITASNTVLAYHGVNQDQPVGQTTGATGGNESRGKNTAVYWYVRIR